MDNRVEEGPKRPPAVDEIATVLNLAALALLVIACVILVFDVAANARSDIAFDAGGIPGLLVGVMAALLVKLTRDFRALRRWTLPYVGLVLRLIVWDRTYQHKLKRADVRRAFGLSD